MFDVNELKTLSSGWQKLEYTWRDTALYALAVGAGKDDLIYTYEKNMKTIPSFAATPYYNAVNVEPKRPLPYPVNYLAKDYVAQRTGIDPDELKAMHAGFEMVCYRPIDPIKGTLVFNSTISKVYDRGSVQKGIAIEVDNPIYDESGQLLCRNTSYHMIPGLDGSNCPKQPKVVVEFPEREPDYVVASCLSATQNVLYRLTGDINYVHIDPELANARTKSDKGPFMQGLSSFGYACRMAIEAVIPAQPEKMKRLYVQMRNIAYPDSHVELRGWKVEEKKMVFKYVDIQTGKAILDNCIFEWF